MSKNSGKTRSFFTLQRKYLAFPYMLFLLLFVVAPILIIVFYAFTNENMEFSFDACVGFFTNPNKLNVLFVSLFIAFQTTLICLLIGYPLAYFLADKKVNKNAVLITLFIAPMWINFVLRTWATRDLLTWIGLSGGKYPYLATLIGMVQNYLPFVVLPLYTTMLKLDHSQIEAAYDLGANPRQVFFKNIIPQSIPGIVSACMMTFMPTMSSYVIANKMSEGNKQIIGSMIEDYFLKRTTELSNHIGSVVSLVMLLIVGVSLVAEKALSKDPNTKKGEVY